jgi:cytochrome c5
VIIESCRSHFVIVLLMAGIACGSGAADSAAGSADGVAVSKDEDLSGIRRNYDLALGKAVFTGKCMVCHGEVLSGAPQYGDYEAWGARIAQGTDTLVQHALNGHGDMPAKGGLSTLSDEEVEAAVAYVIDRSERMIANRERWDTDCTRENDHSRCRPREYERAMILQLLWLLGGQASDAGH